MNREEYVYRLNRARRHREHAHWLLMWDKRDPLPKTLLDKGVKPMLVEKAQEYLREAIHELQLAKIARTQ